MWELDKVANVEVARLVHEQELAFHVRNRRNKQLGLWLAAELGLTEEALDYAKTIVALGIAEPDDEILVQRIRDGVLPRQVRIPEAAIRFQLERETARGAGMRFPATFDAGRSLAAEGNGCSVETGFPTHSNAVEGRQLCAAVQT